MSSADTTPTSNPAGPTPASRASPRASPETAAIYAWYSTTPPATLDLTPPTEDPETLIDRAVAAGGAHTIKFTEVCLREYALHPKPVYLVAARDAAERVGPI